VSENERRAMTEALFRDVNERIAESAERFDAVRTEFVCECADPNCTHRVSASLAEYETVREDPTTFLLVPGHEEEDIERVSRIYRDLGIEAVPLLPSRHYRLGLEGAVA